MSDDENAGKTGFIEGMGAEQKQQFIELMLLLGSLMVGMFGLMFLLLWLLMGENGAQFLPHWIILFVGAGAGLAGTWVYSKISGYKLRIKKQQAQISKISYRQYTVNLAFSPTIVGIMKLRVDREKPKTEVTVNDENAAQLLESSTMDSLMHAQLTGRLPEILEIDSWGAKFHEILSSLPRADVEATDEIKALETQLQEIFSNIKNMQAGIVQKETEEIQTKKAIEELRRKKVIVAETKQVRRLQKEESKLEARLTELQQLKADARQYIQKDVDEITRIANDVIVDDHLPEFETIKKIETQLALLDKIQQQQYNKEIGEIQTKITQQNDYIKKAGGQAIVEIENELDVLAKRLEKTQGERSKLEKEIMERGKALFALQEQIKQKYQKERRKKRVELLKKYEKENPDLFKDVTEFEKLKELNDKETSEIEKWGPMSIGPGAVFNELKNDNSFPLGKALVEILSRKNPNFIVDIPESDLVARILVPEDAPSFERIEEDSFVNMSERDQMEDIVNSGDSAKIDAFIHILQNIPKMVIFIEPRGRVEIERKRVFFDEATGHQVEAYEIECNDFFWGTMGNIPIMIDIMSLAEMGRMYNYKLTLTKLYKLLFDSFVFFIQSLVANQKNSADSSKKLVIDLNLAIARAEKAEKHAEALQMENQSEQRDRDYKKPIDNSPTPFNWRWYIGGVITGAVTLLGIWGLVAFFLGRG